MEYRYVPFITLSEIASRVWITLSDCNFKCRGCFSPARVAQGKNMSVNQLVELVKRASLNYYQKLPQEIIITGGEPTLNRDYLVELVSKLDFSEVVLETNGYLLDEEYLDDLIAAGLSEVMLDLKAYDKLLHKWYTGFSNDRILKNVGLIHKKIPLVIITVYIPGLIEKREIEKISRFISQIDPQIEYRINYFKPVKDLSRKTRNLEIEDAYSSARKYLKNVLISKSCRRESKSFEKKSWITVFPDGTFKRRTLRNYPKK